MVDLEVVSPADGREQRRDGGLVQILDALAPGADQVMVVFDVAGDVRGDVAVALEAAGHAVLHLRLEGAVDGGAPQGRVARLDPVVELLSAERALRGRERQRHHDALLGEPAALRRHPLGDLRRSHRSRIARLTLGLSF